MSKVLSMLASVSKVMSLLSSVFKIQSMLAGVSLLMLASVSKESLLII